MRMIVSGIAAAILLLVFGPAAAQAPRAVRGAKPGDLPVEQATKFELIVNLKTAKTLGLTLSPAILARADRIIE